MVKSSSEKLTFINLVGANHNTSSALVQLCVQRALPRPRTSARCDPRAPPWLDKLSDPSGKPELGSLPSHDKHDVGQVVLVPVLVAPTTTTLVPR